LGSATLSPIRQLAIQKETKTANDSTNESPIQIGWLTIGRRGAWSKYRSVDSFLRCGGFFFVP
jgi:hypothetical protein